MNGINWLKVKRSSGLIILLMLFSSSSLGLISLPLDTGELTPEEADLYLDAEIPSLQFELFTLYGDLERKPIPENPFRPWEWLTPPPDPDEVTEIEGEPEPEPEEVVEVVEEEPVFPPPHILRGVAGPAGDRYGLLVKDGRSMIVEEGDIIDRWQVISIEKDELIMEDIELGQKFLLRLGGEESEKLP